MNSVKHVAIIMDGNGRWGLKHKKSRNLGHKEGLNTVEKIIKATIKNKIKYLTLYAFSTENWKRPKTEVNFLFKLIISYFKKELEKVILNGIKINILGKITQLPLKLRLSLKEVMYRTKKNKKIIVNLAINYGSQDEIVYAAKKTKKNVNIHSIKKNLYTKNLPNPEILIRTGGHKRLSNFLLWQLAYAEIYFLDKLWPDFNGTDLKKIVNNYKKVKRNFGSI